MKVEFIKNSVVGDVRFVIAELSWTAGESYISSHGYPMRELLNLDHIYNINVEGRTRFNCYFVWNYQYQNLMIWQDASPLTQATIVPPAGKPARVMITAIGR